MNLWSGLRLQRSSRAAFVGAGGKTSSMFACARDYNGPILVTVTTHLAVEEAALADFAFEVASPDDVDKIFTAPVNGITLIYGVSHKPGRFSGSSGDILRRLKKHVDALNLPLLIEADGSRGIPIKAPYEHEPLIPEWVNHVIVVCGLSVIGKPASEETIYNANAFLKMVKGKSGESISPSHILEVLLNHKGGRKNIADEIQTSVFLNQWDTRAENVHEFGKIWLPLLEKYDRVLIGNAGKKVQPPEIAARIEKTAGIILAAGKSSRFGEPKQLLQWRGKPFVRRIAERALASGLDPVIVVVGAVVDPIKAALEGLPVKIVTNPDWESGQASSILSALAALENSKTFVGGALFFVSDMPQVSASLVEKLMATHQELDSEIISPRYKGQKTNPILFDRKLFPELKKIKGDQGGRALFKDHEVDWIDISDSEAGIDVDTVSDYENLLKMDGQIGS